jgi:hypothetical protein
MESKMGLSRQQSPFTGIRNKPQTEVGPRTAKASSGTWYANDYLAPIMILACLSAEDIAGSYTELCENKEWAKMGLTKETLMKYVAMSVEDPEEIIKKHRPGPTTPEDLLFNRVYAMYGMVGPSGYEPGISASHPWARTELVKSGATHAIRAHWRTKKVVSAGELRNIYRRHFIRT